MSPTSPLSLQSSPERLRPLWALKAEDVTLSQAFWTKWKLDVLAFVWHGRESAPTSASEYVEYLREIFQAKKSHRHLWRLLATSFHDFVAQAKLETCGHSIQDLTHQCDGRCAADEMKKWTRQGRRYGRLADAVGGSACLLLLPHRLSDYMLGFALHLSCFTDLTCRWEQFLPQYNITFTAAIQTLERCHILEKATRGEADIFVNYVEDILKNTLRKVFWFENGWSRKQPGAHSSGPSTIPSTPSPAETHLAIRPSVAVYREAPETHQINFANCEALAGVSPMSCSCDGPSATHSMSPFLKKTSVR